MRDFRKLDVWQKSHHLTLEHVRSFCGADRTAGVRSAPADGPGGGFGACHIAEGCGRTGDPELRRFCRMALGSASELEYHFLLARDLGLLPAPAYEALTGQVIEVKKMLTGFIARLKSNAPKS